jgi:alkylhydroperoxidase/carboxymuconolactone decarboxylase family protein YurZ
MRADATTADEAIDAVAELAPEVAGGYRQIRAVIASDGALPGATKALLVAAAAAACGCDALARAELERGREIGLSEDQIATTATALLLGRGEVVCGRFVDAAGGLTVSAEPRPAWDRDREAYFREYLGADTLPGRMRIMADNLPEVFAGYQRMHHGALAADPAASKLCELALVALNAAELQTRFAAIHAATARSAGATDAELLEAVVCAIPVAGVAAWAAGSEGLFASA